MLRKRTFIVFFRNNAFGMNLKWILQQQNQAHFLLLL